MRCSERYAETWLRQHFSGSISLSRERLLRAHLPTCASCRVRYARHMLLAELDPCSKGPKDRLGAALGLTVSNQPRRAYLSSAFRVVAAASIMTALLVTIYRARLHREVQEFAARGPAAVSVGSPELLAYRVRDSERPVPLVDSMLDDDRLAFAYVNPEGTRRLMIFGVDEHRHVYWYFPGWLDPAETPRALTIQRETHAIELPEAIRHSLDGQELIIVGLFTDEDLSVRDVEQMVLSSSASPPAVLPRLGPGEQRQIRVSVRQVQKR